MAGRPIKQGIDYFPLDTSFFSDVKIRKIARACGPNAASVLICLLCNIYRDNGYYIVWDEDLPFCIADEVGVSEGCVKEVLLKAVQVGFFDVEKHSAYGILTSSGIQKRFFEITRQRTETEIVPEFLINPVNNSIFHVKNSINPVSNEQSKGIKVKRRKSKEKPKEEDKETSPDGEAKKGGLSLPNTQKEKIDYQALMCYYNTTFQGKLPEIKSMTDTRKKAVSARIAQYGKNSVTEAFRNVLDSPFLLGDNDRNWKADFDWIFKSEHYTRILERRYNGKRTDTNAARRESRNHLASLAAEILAADATKNGL